MHNLHTYRLELGNTGVHQMVAITTERINNDHNGNPVYLSTVFTVDREGNGTQWTPAELGSRRKDGKFRTMSHEGPVKVSNRIFRELQIIINEEEETN